MRMRSALREHRRTRPPQTIQRGAIRREAIGQPMASRYSGKAPWPHVASATKAPAALSETCAALPVRSYASLLPWPRPPLSCSHPPIRRWAPRHRRRQPRRRERRYPHRWQPPRSPRPHRRQYVGRPVQARRSLLSYLLTDPRLARTVSRRGRPRPHQGHPCRPPGQSRPHRPVPKHLPRRPLLSSPAPCRTRSSIS